MHRYRIGIALVFVLFFGPRVLRARDSVIGEKQLSSGTSVVSVAETAPKVEAPPSKKKVEAGYDKGFFIQSPDGNYKLKVTGYFQFQFNLENEGGETDYGFQIRRARIAFSGNLVNPKLTYKLQLNLVQFSTDLLLDLYVNYALLAKDLNVQVGQFTIPYIRQQIISSSNQVFVERSLASIEFTDADDQDSDGDGIADKLVKNGRDIGIMVHGTPIKNKVEYQVGIFNGNGTNHLNFNNHFLYAGRAVVNILGEAGYSYEGDYANLDDPAVFLGAAANYNQRNISHDKVLSMGAETGIKYKGFAASGEFMLRNTKPGDVLLTSGNDYGYYAQASYFVLPKKMEVAARLSQVFFHGVQNDEGEVQFGLNGFLYKENLKLQTDYSYLPTNTKDGLEKGQRWRLRLQAKF